MAYSLTGVSYSLRMRQARTLLDSVKAGVESQDLDLVGRAIMTRGAILGSRRSRADLADLIVARVSGSADHDDVSQGFFELASRLERSPIHSTGLFVIENLARAVGCFAASLSFGKQARHRIVNAPMQSDLQRTQVFLAHLHNQDLDRAIATWHRKTPRPHTAEFWHDAGHMLWLVTDGAAGQADLVTSGSWAETLQGRQVLALGPAPTSLEGVDSSASLIARVVAPGVTSWPESDAVGGRIDLSYANSDSAKWFVVQDNREVFDSVSFASFRTDVWKSMNLANGRTARHHKRLLPMPFDKTNMVPLIAWDVLHVPDVQLSIAGTTFFASQAAYTPHDVRLKQQRGRTTDQRGSTGLSFERCLSFSSHNLSAHHTLMALLAAAGRLRFDPEGQAVIDLSTHDYLSAIDRLYGQAAV